MSRRSRLSSRQTCVLIASMLFACGPERTAAPASIDDALARRAQATYAEIAFAAYSDAVSGAEALRASIDALLARPSEQTLAAAKKAWLAAREPYLQTEVYRFYEGPIDAVELLINTWPIDENVVEGGADARGVIDDVAAYPTLSAELLTKLNARDGETSITTGYHVIEFLLWGRDESKVAPGARSSADFVLDPARPLNERRRAYLALSAGLLIRHLAQVRDAWAPGQKNYRSEFSALAPRAALARIVKGMGTLSGPELAGERLTVPYETRDQENEHSCFSDNTHRDVIGDLRGVQNLCLGTYTRDNGKVVRGTGLCKVVASVDPVVARELEQRIAKSLELAQNIPPPFDAALDGDDQGPGRTAIRNTIRAIEAHTKTVERAAALFGIGSSPRPGA